MDVAEVDCGSLHSSEFSDEMERSFEAINTTIYSDFGFTLAELCATLTPPSPTPVRTKFVPKCFVYFNFLIYKLFSDNHG